MGCLGLLFPRSMASVAGLALTARDGVSEMRASFGLSRIVLGALPLMTGASVAYVMAGLYWAALALARLVFMVPDRAFSWRSASALLFEATAAGCLLIGHPYNLLLALVT